MLDFRPGSGFGDLRHRVQQFGDAIGRVLVGAGVVQAAAILQQPVAVQAEKIRRANRAPAAGHRLVLVDQIGKREVVLGGEFFHLRRRVVRIVLVVVGHHGDRADAALPQRAGVGGQAVGDGPDIGAVVADEGDQQAVFAREAGQVVAPAVGVGQVKFGGPPSDFAGRAFHQGHFFRAGWA